MQVCHNPKSTFITRVDGKVSQATILELYMAELVGFIATSHNKGGLKALEEVSVLS